jgi:hypothetical protein
MAERQKDMGGVIFPKDKDRILSDKHPTHSGSCTINGRQYWISGWHNEGQKGPYLALAFKPKDEERGGGGENRSSNSPPARRDIAGQPRGAYQVPNAAEDFNDDIPF